MYVIEVEALKDGQSIWKDFAGPYAAQPSTAEQDRQEARFRSERRGGWQMEPFPSPKWEVRAVTRELHPIDPTRV